MFLINDDQAQVFKTNILLNEAMCPNDNVNFAFFELVNDLLLFPGCLKTAEHGNVNGKIPASMSKGLIMLISQNSGRHQYGYLLIIQHCLKRSPEGYLSFSIAYVSAD